MNNKVHEKKGFLGFNLGTMGLAAAAAIGATLAVVFSQKNNKLGNRLNRSREEIQNMLKNIFGEVSEELEKDYMEIKGNIHSELDSTKDEAELTKEKYEDIVYDAVNNFKRSGRWTRKNIERLIHELQKDWDRLKK